MIESALKFLISRTPLHLYTNDKYSGQPFEPSSTHTTCTNLLNDTICTLYIDSSATSNKNHTYATAKENLKITYSTNEMQYTLKKAQLTA